MFICLIFTVDGAGASQSLDTHSFCCCNMDHIHPCQDTYSIRTFIPAQNLTLWQKYAWVKLNSGSEFAYLFVCKLSIFSLLREGEYFSTKCYWKKYCKKYLSILIFLVFNLHPKMYICFKEAAGVDAWKSNSGTIRPILHCARGEKMTFF